MNKDSNKPANKSSQKSLIVNALTTIGKIILFPFWLVFNLLSFFFFGMSLRRFLKPDAHVKWHLTFLRITSLGGIILILPFLIHHLSTADIDILPILVYGCLISIAAMCILWIIH